MSDKIVNPYEGLDPESIAFLMDADRLERIHNREINRTPEVIAQEKKADEQADDIEKLIAGTMTKEEYKKKWNVE